jgi:hypothetical protein
MSDYTDDMKLYGAVLYAILSESPYVGPLVGTRIYPVIIEQDVVLPAIAYTYEVQPVNIKNGRNKMEDAIYNIYCFGKSYEGCIHLTQAVRDSLDRGGQSQAAGITFQQLVFVGQDHAQYDKDRQLYMIPVVYRAQLTRVLNI